MNKLLIEYNNKKWGTIVRIATNAITLTTRKWKYTNLTNSTEWKNISKNMIIQKKTNKPTKKGPGRKAIVMKMELSIVENGSTA